jgi:hypothetical protein
LRHRRWHRRPDAVYIVEFTPTELWGPRAEPGAHALYAELYEAYLEAIK